MWCAGAAVVDALAAEAATDAAFQRPDETGKHIGAVVIAFALGRDGGLLARDAGGDLGRRIDGFLWHPGDALHRPVTFLDGDVDALAGAVGVDDGDARIAAFIATDTEGETAIGGDAQGMFGVGGLGQDDLLRANQRLWPQH